MDAQLTFYYAKSTVGGRGYRREKTRRKEIKIERGVERGGCDRWVGRYIILGLLPHWMTARSWGPRQQFKEPLSYGS